VVLLTLILLEPRWRVNLTSSVPVGLYWRSNSFAKGDFVELCPPDAIEEEALKRGFAPRLNGGPCYDHGIVFIKVIAAVGGDILDVSQRGVSIDGKLWPGSARRRFDSHGMPITQWMHYGRLRLPSNTVLVLGTNPDSFDGRVWGPMKVSGIRARLTPLVTWKGY
jgi:conjugative transfer signal peptidase TraF